MATTHPADDEHRSWQHNLSCSNEHAWHDQWHVLALGNEPPLTMAAMGGAAADRLAWVFVAGYQAAIRSCFPDVPANGWAAVAVTEPKDRPAAALAQGKVQGTKSWIAGVDQVTWLVVRVAGTWQLVRRGAVGLQLSRRDAPRFLADLSQGAADFSAVAPQEQLVAKAHFGITEAGCMLVALTGFALGQGAGREASELLQELAAVPWDDDPVPRLLVLSPRVEQLVARVGPGTPGWQQDQALVAMYGKSLARR